jgi:hypothetical protein
MHETPAVFNEAHAIDRRYPHDDLSGFRWHTGATLRPVAQGEECPVLFRDVGPVALALFLRGRLPRLAGPLSPLVYMRTADYVEPYSDHEHIGRLVILRPLLLQPWHAGTPRVFVARAVAGVDHTTIGFIPGATSLSEAAHRVRDAGNTNELREALGGRAHDDAVDESLSVLDRLEGELARTEMLAVPLRRSLQSPDRKQREQARTKMDRVGLTESDLCTAWHHLSRERRGWIAEALAQIDLCREGPS